MSSMARTTAPGSGLRCSSTGVPTTTTTWSTSPMCSGSVVRVRLPLASTRARTSSAPFS